MQTTFLYLSFLFFLFSFFALFFLASYPYTQHGQYSTIIIKNQKKNGELYILLDHQKLSSTAAKVDEDG